MSYETAFQENFRINIHVVKRYKYLKQVKFPPYLCVEKVFVSDTFRLKCFGYLKELTNFCKIL